MSEYWLPRHVSFGCHGDAIVFLDLRNDDYTLIHGTTAAALKSLATHSSVDATSLEELLGAGLLTTDRKIGKEITPTRVDPALDVLSDRKSIRDARVTLSHVVRFVWSCTKAMLRLRLFHIERTVTAVKRRKERAALPPDDPQAVRELTAVFLKLRSFFPTSYLCLYDSLALLEFLAAYDFFPTWIFGVRLDPWSAHCWIQLGPLVLNEGAEEAAAYTAVMAV